MLDWAKPEYTWIVLISAVVFGLIIILIMRLKNVEFPRLETRQKQLEKQQRQNNGNPSKNPPIHPVRQKVEDNVARSQSTVQPPKPETTKIKHGKNQR
jgi:uncharacterized membrane-anchored protein YhcB (DUF1043 family)